MDTLGEQPRPEQLTAQVEQAIGRTLEKVDLESFLSTTPGQTPHIAILGAGMALETRPLNEYFIMHGLGAPKITAYDKQPSLKRLTEGFLNQQEGSGGINIEYNLEDIANPNSFRGDKYDLVIVRNPDVHNVGQGWEKAFENGFAHLNSKGIFFVTTEAYADFVLSELRKGGELLEKYSIPPSDRISPFFDENDLFIARKGDQ